MESELKLKEIWLCKNVPTGTGSGEPQTHFLPADTLNWLVHWFGGSCSLIESPPHGHPFPTESLGGLRHWHTWTTCFNDLLAVGKNSQLRVSRVPVTFTSQRSPFNQQCWDGGPYGDWQVAAPVLSLSLEWLSCEHKVSHTCCAIFHLHRIPISCKKHLQTGKGGHYQTDDVAIFLQPGNPLIPQSAHFTTAPGF